jgi:membrane protease YdiL (CAAX protease family)
MGGAWADEASTGNGYVGFVPASGTSSDFLTVDYVAAKGPADVAGIKMGEEITSINGISTRGMSLTEAWRTLEGAIGTTVKLTVRDQGKSEEQITIVRRSAPFVYLAAATRGDTKAQFYLAEFYEGETDPPNAAVQAAEWYLKAASQGYAPAQSHLAYMLRHGMGIPKDPVAAVGWDLKAAKQGNAWAETGLGLSYLTGDGVLQSDGDAFAWFYSAAQQDEPKAEQNLAYLYLMGRGVKQDDQAAFGWYYRSAQRGDFYGEWGLAYMYEYGRGVKKSTAESLKWYLMAHAGLPEKEKLTDTTARMSLRAFVENPETSTMDVALITEAFRSEILLFFFVLTLIYGIAGLGLGYFSLREADAPAKLSVAIGWMLFYVESQAVALLSIFIFGKTLTAGTMLVAMAVFGCLPIIASTLGPSRNRIWKASQVPWKTLFLYGASACAAFLIIGMVQAGSHALTSHLTPPVQPTQVLVSKVKHESVWLGFLCIALAMPITEEIIFRSYLFDALKRRFSMTTVVIVTAFAFSVAHFQWLFFVPLFGFGLVLGWVRFKTDSLRLPIFLHALNNGLFLLIAS